MKEKIVRSQVIKGFLKRYTKLYKMYKDVKRVFVEPELHFKFGRWTKDPNLPFWRQGPVIRLSRKNTAADDVSWTERYKKKHPILTRIFRRAILCLPIWMTFRKFNWGVGWKTKWEDYRYEFPPQLTLVFFGLSISFWLVQDEEYWEGILYYTDPAEMSGRSVYNECLPEFKKDIVVVGKQLGVWRDGTTGKNFYAFKPEYLESPYRKQWEKYIEEHPVNPKKTRK